MDDRMTRDRIKALTEEIEKLQEKIRDRESYYGYDKLCKKYDAMIQEKQWAIEMYEMRDMRGGIINEDI